MTERDENRPPTFKSLVSLPIVNRIRMYDRGEYKYLQSSNVIRFKTTEDLTRKIVLPYFNLMAYLQSHSDKDVAPDLAQFEEPINEARKELVKILEANMNREVKFNELTDVLVAIRPIPGVFDLIFNERIESDKTCQSWHIRLIGLTASSEAFGSYDNFEAALSHEARTDFHKQLARMGFR